MSDGGALSSQEVERRMDAVANSLNRHDAVCHRQLDPDHSVVFSEGAVWRIIKKVL